MRDFDLRELQLAEFEMLKAVAEVCKKHNIRYFLLEGTLLGAIRHQGFIPWDDDIDIGMDAKNYKKFLKVAQKELEPKYFVQNYRTEKKVFFPWTKVRINGTTSMSPRLSNLDIHFGVCMDIFVMNGLSDFEPRRKMQEKAVTLQTELLRKHYCLEKGDEIRSGKKKIMYKVLPDFMRRWLIRLLEHMIFIDLSKCSLCYINYYQAIEQRSKNKAEWFLNLENKVFETEEFLVPCQYEEYLTCLYGDWRTPPPEEDRKGHGDIIVDLKNDYKIYCGDKTKKEEAES